MEAFFPFQGKHEGVPTTKQPVMTSPRLSNVWPFNKVGRLTGGQRGGTTKAFSTRVGGNHPIIAMCDIATTYIQPED